jgi:molecular chaperone GrpE (heat shock protein)
VALKTKKALMKPEKITQTETEIKQLEEQLLRIDAELEKRKGTE